MLRRILDQKAAIIAIVVGIAGICMHCRGFSSDAQASGQMLISQVLAGILDIIAGMIVKTSAASAENASDIKSNTAAIQTSAVATNHNAEILDRITPLSVTVAKVPVDPKQSQLCPPETPNA